MKAGARDPRWAPLWAQTEDILAARASRYFPELGDATVRRLPFVGGSTYPIQLYELRGSSLARKVIVKLAPVFEENNEGRTEIENMARLWNHARRGEPGLGYVRPVEFIPETNAVVSEFIEGERFSSVLLRGCRDGSPGGSYRVLEDAVGYAGRWLRVMHDASPAGTSPLGETPAVTTFERALDDLSRRRLLVGPVAMIRAVLRQGLRAIAGLPARAALMHGDYAPGNMLWADGRIYVFDLQFNTSEAIYFDLSFFLVTLQTINPYPRYFLFSRRKARALERPFLDGYFGRSLARDELLLLRFFCLRSLVQRAFLQFTELSARPVGALLARAAVEMFYQGMLRSEARGLAALMSSISRRPGSLPPTPAGGSRTIARP